MLKMKLILSIFVLFFALGSVAEELKSFAWNEPKIDLTVLNDIKDMSIKEMIEYAEDELGVIVLIDHEMKSTKSQLNEEMLRVSNSSENEKLLEDFKKEGQLPHGGVAAYLGPRSVVKITDSKNVTRPAYEDAVIVLTRYSTRATVIEEILHHMHDLSVTRVNTETHWLTEAKIKDSQLISRANEASERYSELYQKREEAIKNNTLYSFDQTIYTKTENEVLTHMLSYEVHKLLVEFRLGSEEVYLKSLILDQSKELGIPKNLKLNVCYSIYMHIKKIHITYDNLLNGVIYLNAKNRKGELGSIVSKQVDLIDSNAQVIEKMLAEKYKWVLREVLRETSSFKNRLFVFMIEDLQAGKKINYHPAKKENSQDFDFVLWTGLSVMKDE